MSNKKTFRKYAATTVAAAAAVASVAPVATAAETTQGFTDVTEANTGDHYEKIVALQEAGIIGGYADGTFSPWTDLTRGQAAKMMVEALEALGEPIADPADLEEALAGFSDVDEGHTFDVYIAKAAAAGIFGGYEDGTFGAYADLTRQQMAKVLVETFDLDEIETDNDVEVNFDKVSPGQQDYVQIIANLGITNQVPNFEGYSNITRAAFASMLFDSIEVVKENQEELVIESVSAINATTISVTFDNGETAEIELEQTLEDGLNTITFQYEGQTFTDVEVYYDAPTGIEFDILQAIPQSNTEVTLILKDAPLQELKASDIDISPSLNIVSVTTNNNVVVLKTSPQQVGTTYTVSSSFGSGQSATFTGVEATSTIGAIQSVTVENNRELLVEFNTPVDPASVNINNLYLGMTENDDDYDVDSRTIAQLADNGNSAGWTVTPVDDTDTKYLIHSETDVAELDDLGLKYNENATLEARNVVDANGFIHTSQGGFTWTDTTPPTVKTAPIVEVEHGETPELVLDFSEPIDTRVQNPDYKIYINGVEIDYNIYTDVLDNGDTVADHSTARIDLSNYDYDVDHEIKIVGSRDLQGNVQVPNIYDAPFRIQEADPAQATLPARAAVEVLDQTADNVFYVVFDQENVEGYEDGKVLTLKQSAWVEDNTHPNGGEWEDIVIYYDATNDDYFYDDQFNDPVDIDITSVPGSGITTWTFTLDVELDRTAGDSNEFNYDGQILAERDLIIENYIVAGAKNFGTQTPLFKGVRYADSYVFERDVTAPTIESYDYDVANGTLYVSFKDEPFDGIIQLNAVAERITVSRTDANNVTTDHNTDTTDGAITVGAADHLTLNGEVFEAGKYVALNISGVADLTDGGELIRNNTYRVTFSDDSVQDANRAGEATLSPDFPHGILESSASIHVPGVDETGGEGLVPQTTPYLIASGKDIANHVDPTVEEGLGYDELDATLPDTLPGSRAYMTDNENLIMVIFEGEVLESSATNKKNYKFNGQELTAGTTVTFYEEDIRGTGTDEQFVIIDLESGTVDKNGLYTFSAEGVTNRAGKRMLPVNTSVALTDNTPPVAKSVRVIGDTDVEVTFNEEVDFTADARRNFAVTVNGIPYSVSGVSQPGSDKTKLVLTLSDRFTFAGAKATVTVVKDNNGRIFIEDNEGNDAASGVELSN